MYLANVTNLNKKIGCKIHTKKIFVEFNLITRLDPRKLEKNQFVSTFALKLLE